MRAVQIESPHRRAPAAERRRRKAAKRRSRTPVLEMPLVDGGGERALMGAVLQDAILCVVGQGHPQRDRLRLADEALYWVSLRDTTWAFSFESICDALGIDPDGLRRRLFRSVAAGVAATENDCNGHQAANIRRLRSYRQKGNTHTGEARRRAVRRHRRRPAHEHATDPSAGAPV